MGAVVMSSEPLVEIARVCRRPLDAVTRGWTRSGMDDTLRSRLAHGFREWHRWYAWGRPVMWLVGRNDSGSAGIPRGRDLWWIPTQYVEERLIKSYVADFEQRWGCYITREYAQVRLTSGDIDWRIFDLRDDGTNVLIGLWPNQPEHKGRIQPMPTWHTLNRKSEMRLFLWWYLWEHKGKAQWFGLRHWIYFKALNNAVGGHSPFSCAKVPAKRSGGYSHWHCQRRKFHRGDEHRFNNMVWTGAGRVEHRPEPLTSPERPTP